MRGDAARLEQRLDVRSRVRRGPGADEVVQLLHMREPAGRRREPSVGRQIHQLRERAPLVVVADRNRDPGAGDVRAVVDARIDAVRRRGGIAVPDGLGNRPVAAWSAICGARKWTAVSVCATSM
jgi:hypothetical protein